MRAAFFPPIETAVIADCDFNCCGDHRVILSQEAVGDQRWRLFGLHTLAPLGHFFFSELWLVWKLGFFADFWKFLFGNLQSSINRNFQNTTFGVHRWFCSLLEYESLTAAFASRRLLRAGRESWRPADLHLMKMVPASSFFPLPNSSTTRSCRRLKTSWGWVLGR